MAKILVALDEKCTFVDDLVTVTKDFFPESAEHLFYACVVKDLAYTSPISNFVKESSLSDNLPGGIQHISDENIKKTEVISSFEKSFRKENFRYQFHNDFKITAHELVKQTTYADLLIISYEIFLTAPVLPLEFCSENPPVRPDEYSR